MFKRGILFTFIFTIFLAFAPCAFSMQELVAKKITNVPLIDGDAKDEAWQNIPGIVTHDKIADIDVTLKAAHNGKNLFFLVTFPDKDENRTHKSWIWNDKLKVYEVGYDREDVFTIKWNIEENPVNLSIYGDDAHRADVWYWKAFRTDPSGFADDKYDILSDKYSEDAVKVESKTGQERYLLRKEDEGDACYKTVIQIKHEGDILPRFIQNHPSRSRADIKAKGVWANGRWTIEFERNLVTNNSDDAQFDISKEYEFGISRYEIAARPIEPDLDQPLYGSGDVSEELMLSFEQ